MEKSLINDFLKKHQKECIEEVEYMKLHPLSLKEKEEQIKRNHELSMKYLKERKNKLSKNES